MSRTLMSNSYAFSPEKFRRVGNHRFWFTTLHASRQIQPSPPFVCVLCCAKYIWAKEWNGKKTESCKSFPSTTQLKNGRFSFTSLKRRWGWLLMYWVFQSFTFFAVRCSGVKLSPFKTHRTYRENVLLKLFSHPPLSLSLLLWCFLLPSALRGYKLKLKWFFDEGMNCFHRKARFRSQMSPIGKIVGCGAKVAD